MDNHTIKTVFNKYLIPLNFKVIEETIDEAGIDKYVKKLSSLMMLKLFIYAQLKKVSNLGRLSEHVKRKNM